MRLNNRKKKEQKYLYELRYEETVYENDYDWYAYKTRNELLFTSSNIAAMNDYLLRNNLSIPEGAYSDIIPVEPEIYLYRYKGKFYIKRRNI